MIPVVQNFHQYGTTEFRIASTSILPLPPNHVLLYCMCPCGMHRTHFTVDRNVLLNHMMRNEPMDARGQPHIPGLPQVRLRLRLGRMTNRKPNERMQINSLQEDVDR